MKSASLLYLNRCPWISADRSFPFLSQMRLGLSSVASWSTALPASVAQSPSPWPTWCRGSTSLSTTLTTLSRGRSPTFPQTSTSWASSWTLRGRWGCTVPVTTVPPARSSSSSPRQPITTSSSWTRWSRHEGRLDSLFVVSCGVSWGCLSLSDAKLADTSSKSVTVFLHQKEVHWSVRRTEPVCREHAPLDPV